MFDAQVSTRRAWLAMLERYPNDVAPEWATNYSAFVRDMGLRTQAKPLLKRSDASQPFGPDNCQWAARNPPKAGVQCNRKIDPAEMPLLLEMVELGTPILEVAAAFGVTGGAIRNILCRRGIKARQRRSATSGWHVAKLDAAKVADIRARHAKGERVADLAREYGVSARTIYCAVSGKTWRHNLNES